MTKHLLLASLATAVLIAAGPVAVSAETDTPTAKEQMNKKMKRERPQSRAEAIQHTQERLDKLNSMSDAQWQEHKDKRKKRKEKFKNMTPEERKAFKEKRKEKRAAE